MPVRRKAFRLSSKSASRTGPPICAGEDRQGLTGSCVSTGGGVLIARRRKFITDSPEDSLVPFVLWGAAAATGGSGGAGVVPFAGAGRGGRAGGGGAAEAGGDSFVTAAGRGSLGSGNANV